LRRAEALANRASSLVARASMSAPRLVLAVLTSPFKSRLRLEAENAAFRSQSRERDSRRADRRRSCSFRWRLHPTRRALPLQPAQWISRCKALRREPSRDIGQGMTAALRQDCVFAPAMARWATLGATPWGHTSRSWGAGRPYLTGLSRSRFIMAEREGLSGGFFRSPYISEKSCDRGGLRDTSRTTARTTFAARQSTAAKIATVSQVHNLKTGSKHSWLKRWQV
jgi:hypothetical protein